MLSSTSGYTKRSRVLGSRRDDTTLRSTLCPALRVRGVCRAQQKENAVRAQLAAAKEEELRRTAAEVYALQEEVLHDGAVAVAAAGEEADSKRAAAAAIESIVEEIKREPAYVNWSLDVAVAECMASRRMRRCPYAHQREVLTALRQPKRREEAAACGHQQQQQQQQKQMGHARKAKAMRGRDGAVERQRIFKTLTPLQKCIVCLLWQGSYEVPQKVVCDVRRRIEAEEAQQELDVDVEAEEERVVAVTACRAALGVVDVSSIPHILAYVSQHPEACVIHPDTAAYFTGGGGVGIPRGVTEKQTDMSAPACAHEVVEAIVWTLRLMNEEMAQQQQQQQQEKRPVVLRSLALRRCGITAADALINALRKHQLDSTLLALDMSDNRLMNLRLLFTLRAHFSERLLRLSLADNPITRKPEYREQVRQSLPKLTSLDGTTIRRPPLSLPYPSVLSCTFLTDELQRQEHSRRVLSGSELESVMESLARFMYIWETRRIPWTAEEVLEFEQQQQQRQQLSSSSSSSSRSAEKRCEETKQSAVLPPEEELDDDNFHHRYLHPSAVFSMALHEGLAFFQPDVMRLAADVELDDSYAGMRLAPVDVRDLRVFDVAMKGNSRNLLLGRSVLHRYGRGSLNCYTAYKYSLYPQRLDVCHHLGGAVVSVVKITDTARRSTSEASAVPNQPEQQQHQRRKKQRSGSERPTSIAAAAAAAAPEPFSNSGQARKPAFYLVTLHGVMSWRAPSMKRTESVLAAYDRVITFVENALPSTNAVEKRRSAPLLVFNDQVHLRPLTDGDRAYVMGQTQERVARLVVEFGLEACGDGVLLVRAVVERASSDAAASAALRLLVFASDSESEGTEEGEESPLLLLLHQQQASEVGGGDRNTALGTHFDIASLLVEDNVECPPRRVTLVQVDAVVAAMNARHSAALRSGEGSKPPEGKKNEEEAKVDEEAGEPPVKKAKTVKPRKQHR